MTELQPLEDIHSQLDGLEMAMLSQPSTLIDFPLVHRFTNGMYIREIFNPAGSLLTTKIHATEHPFVILQGKISVYVPGEGVQHLEAPCIGITKPGTRRIIYVHEDTVFITFHPNPDNETNLDVIESRLIERRELASGKTSHEFAAELIQRLIEEQSV